MTKSVGRNLRTELAATVARLRLLDGHGGDGVGRGLDPNDLVDTAQAVEQRERGHLAATRLVDRARRLRAALERFERGEYGICEECGDQIAPARLAALPDAATCLSCQERRERAPMSPMPRE